MAEKCAPPGICDLCGQQMPTHTVKGNIRRFCSVECRNTANSRAGNAERTRKLRERVASGEWVNLMHVRPPTGEEQAERARAKLSRPRKHSGALADAIEKLRLPGVGMADLTPEEQNAYRAHARTQARQRRTQWTDEERAEARRKWREAWRRRRSGSQ